MLETRNTHFSNQKSKKNNNIGAEEKKWCCSFLFFFCLFQEPLVSRIQRNGAVLLLLVSRTDQIKEKKRAAPCFKNSKKRKGLLVSRTASCRFFQRKEKKRKEKKRKEKKRKEKKRKEKKRKEKKRKEKKRAFFL